MTLDVISYVNDKKTNFVRLVGPHQAIFMMLVNALTIFVCTVIDSATLGWENLLMVAYVPFMLYLMNRMMEERQETLKKTALAIIVVVMTIAYFELYIYG